MSTSIHFHLRRELDLPAKLMPDHLKYLCKEHLGLDVLISLPKPPPGRRRCPRLAVTVRDE